MDKKKQNILTICSTLDFQNYTRRATIEAIAEKAKHLDIILYTGLKNRFKTKIHSPHLRSTTYHFWIPESLNRFPLLRSLENAVRKPFRKQAFAGYDIIFFTDPNQYRLLPFVEDQTVVYLIRDPNILQSHSHRDGEMALLNRANLVLATSQNLAERYLPEYYNLQHPNIQYWPNCANLTIWKNSIQLISKNDKMTLGMAGNINNRTDLELLDHITRIDKINFELCGKIIEKQIDSNYLNKILIRNNVNHLDFINLNDLPKIVSGWNVGLTIEKKCEYTRFTHHNKIYQYLALGIPVVVLKTHDDYKGLEPYVMTADSYEEYIELIKLQLGRQQSEAFREKCRKLAEENSAEKRAEMFMGFVENIRP